MKKAFLILFAVCAFAATKQEVTKTNKADTLKVEKTDTMTVIKYEQIKVIKTWMDTVKLSKVDTVRTVTFDTVVSVKKVYKVTKAVKTPVKAADSVDKTVLPPAKKK